MNDMYAKQQEVVMYLQSEGIDPHGVRLFLNNNTLRLTKHGFAILYKHMKSWNIEIEDKITSDDLIQLLRKVQTPYFLRMSNKEIILFSEEDAFMAKIAGVKGWIQSK